MPDCVITSSPICRLVRKLSASFCFLRWLRVIKNMSPTMTRMMNIISMEGKSLVLYCGRKKILIACSLSDALAKPLQRYLSRTRRRGHATVLPSGGAEHPSARGAGTQALAHQTRVGHRLHRLGFLSPRDSQSR